MESKKLVVSALRFRSNGARLFFTGAKAAAAAAAAATASAASVYVGKIVKLIKNLRIRMVWYRITYQVALKR